MSSNKEIESLKLNLGEENEIEFSLSIKGNSTDKTKIQPELRFLVTEIDTGNSWVFPLESKENGIVGVKIPSEEIFKENIQYSGKVEVIVAGRYFNPTTVMLQFEKNIEIVANPILKEIKKNDKETDPDIEEFSENILNNSEMIKSAIFSEIKSFSKSEIIHETIKSSTDILKLKNKLKNLILKAWEI